jgi:hypothetical protein
VPIVQILWLVAYLGILSIDPLDSESTLIFFLLLILNSVLIVLPILVGPKMFLSKFTITDNGILWTIYNKKIQYFDWDDILDVYIETRLYRKCLIFDITKHTPGFRKNEFFFNVDKCNIEVLHAFCKNDRITNKIGHFIEKKEYVTPIFIWPKK